MEATDSKLSFFIIYGWISGQGHGRGMKRHLESAGFIEASNPDSADLIITHSAGYYLVPAKTAGKLIILVGPTLNKLSFKTWVHANAENARMFWQDHKSMQGIWLNLLHIADIFLRPVHNLRIAGAARRGNIPLFQNSNVVLVANRDDPWPRPSYLQDIINEKPWIFMSMSGAHESIWKEPEQYAEIIKYYAERLLA